MMPRFRALCLFATSGCATVMLLACLPASAQVVSVTVGGTSAPISPKSPNGTVSAGKGITIGGTFLKHNNPASVWSVSDANSNPVGNPRTATATEIKFLDPIWALSEAAGTAFANGNAANYLDSVDKIFKLAGSVAPDAGGKGNFPFINKPQGTILSADTRLQSNAAIEEARASPTQTQTAINPPTFQRQLLANVKVGNEKEPVALSTAIFKDPEEIQWGSVSTSFYPLQVSLAGLTLSTQSVPDGIGWAFDQTSGSYINDNTNLDAPESSATALYNLRVSEASVNGQTPTYSVLAATSGDGEAMYGGSPVDDATLAMDLTSDIIPGADGLITFSSNAIFTVNIPLGMTGETLLFPNDVDLGFSAVVPEPSTWAMMLLGFGGLGFLGNRARRLARVAS